MKTDEYKNILVLKNLKVTPQRMSVLEAVTILRNHPSSEDIRAFIQQNHPNIALGTIYKTLETFVEKGIIMKVKTERDFMRYDAITTQHHHLYCAESEKIEDYFDEELDNLLKEHFENKKLKHFRIKSIKLQIIGNFTDQPSHSQ